MRILFVVLVVLVLAAPAEACVTLPADSATNVRVGVRTSASTVRTVVRVCGHELATASLSGSSAKRRSGTRIGDASAAGRRVAWIEERHRRGVRTAIVTLANAKGRVLRRFVAERRRTVVQAELHVILTREGDLAYSAGTDNQRGVVALDRAGKPRKRLDKFTANGLKLEAEHTLLWGDNSVDLGLFDLRKIPCPGRAGFTPIREPGWVAGQVEVTSRRYSLPFVDGPVTVVRGCDLSTRRDRVLLVSAAGLNDGGTEDSLYVAGVDRTWVVMYEQSSSTIGPGQWSLTAVDVATGQTVTGPDKWTPAEPPGAALAVSAQGVVAWRDENVMYALVDGRVFELDRGGALSDPSAQGDGIAWTRDGAPRTYPG
jgi:hypothetical protein